VLLWLPLAWVALGPFRVRSIDSWTYFAPVAYARWPLDLHLPLVGAWNGGDTTWAIHWPGALMLYSFATPLLPAAPWVYTSLMVASWLALAVATALLTRALTGSGAWALAALALVLFDRALFESLVDMRGECLGALVLVAVLVGLRQVLLKHDHQALGLAALAGGSFLLPLMHPLAVPLVTLLDLTLLGAWLRRPEKRPALTAALAASVAGTLALVAWFQFHPNGWGQLFEHAQHNARPFSFGGTFLETLRFYAPTYLPVLLVIAGLAETVRRALAAKKSRTLWPALSGEDPALVAGVLLAASLAAQQAFHNFFYYLMTLPLVVALSLSLAAHIVAKLPAPRQRLVALAVLGVVVVHGLYLPMRTALWWQAGQPDFAAKADAVLDRLDIPDNARLVLSPRLWEEARARWPEERVRLVVPDYGAAWPNRFAYAEALTARLQAGDVVIIDPKIPELYPAWRDILSDPARAELLETFDYLTPGTESHGMAFRAYRVLGPGSGGATSPARW